METLAECHHPIPNGYSVSNENLQKILNNEQNSIICGKSTFYYLKKRIHSEGDLTKITNGKSFF